MTPTSDTPTLDALQDASIAEFVVVLIKEFGGAAKFAREVSHEYGELPEGSQARTRLLGLILQLWDKHGGGPLSDDPEELEAAADALEEADE